MTATDRLEHRGHVERVGRFDRWARTLSVVSLTLMGVAALAGLAADDLYRDGEGLRHMLRGHDFVTIVVVVPLVVWSLRAIDGARARLVWLGTLAFASYNYAVYVFGTGFSDLFLVHTLIFEASTVALVLGVVSTDVSRTPAPSERASRWAAGLMLFLAVGLGSMWVANAIRFAVTGESPAESELVLPLASIHLGYALDLTLIVPSYAVVAVLLWRGSTWATTLAPVLLVGGLLQQVTYMSALAFQYRADVPGATAFDPGEPIVVLAYAAALALLLRRPSTARGSSR